MILKLIFLFYLGFSLSIAHAGGGAETIVEHVASFDFFANNRIVLSARITEHKGIDEVRCYFKAGTYGRYFYVPMTSLTGDSYQCFLPGFKSGLGSLEYFFLIINNSGQVIRSVSNRLQEIDSQKNTLDAGAGDSAIIYIYSELAHNLIDDSGVADDRVEFITIRDVKKHYGLRAGIYGAADLPDSVNYMSGFWGGFVLDQPDGVMSPVKGIVVNSPIRSERLLKSSGCPDIAGDDWVGYFTRTDESSRENLTATIELNNCRVTIVTTRTGLGHKLVGKINSSGDMLLYDQYDGEDWTTHDGPANENEIIIYDYIYPPQVGLPPPPLNKIALYRNPQPPADVDASDGVFEFPQIAVSWKVTAGATLYKVYTCNDSTSDNCSELAQTSTNNYDDTRRIIGMIRYRIQACNLHDCSEFSDEDTGYSRLSIVPVYLLL